MEPTSTRTTHGGIPAAASDSATSQALAQQLRGSILPLDAAGGKAVSLMRLLDASLPVPDGFVLTTEAYRQFVAANNLANVVEQALQAYDPTRPDAWDRVAGNIHAAFLAAPIPPAVAAAAQQAYASLSAEARQADALAVAVRSSATAEDLPSASFAGQQETFLNVVGADALLDAVRRCWASLWTSRALAYRERLGIEQRSVAMAVVVQRLTPAEVAGVLFTANPATGARDELLVNASYGLGEAIVSGQVTPDTSVVGRDGLAIRSTSLGEKSLQIVADAAAGHGIVSTAVPEAQQRTPALAPAQLRELAALGLRAERVADGVPQDIEWALADGRFWLLQSRPITGLPPAPLTDVSWEPPTPGSRWVRRQVVEHMPEPLSPLFEELYLQQGLDLSVDQVYAALNAPDDLREIVDRPLFSTINGYAYQRANFKLDWPRLKSLATAVGRSMPLLFQVSQGYWQDRELPTYRATVARWKALDPATLSDRELLDGIRDLAYADARYWYAATLVIGTAKASDAILDSYLHRFMPGRQLSSGQFLRAMSARGLAAERALERVAAIVRQSEPLRAVVERTPPERLRAALAAAQEGQRALTALDEYFDEFGHLIYNLDFAAPTQADDPLPALLSLRALVSQPPSNPDDRLARLARERDILTRQTDRSLDPFRRRGFRTLLRWARRYAPNREEALFYVGLAWPTLRRLALELGRRLAVRGVLTEPDDIFFLKSEEIASASGDSPGADDFATLARERRQLREARRRLHPPAAVPPAYRFKLGPLDLSGRESQRRNTVDADMLSGFAVSPGRVTAPASVIRSPADFGQMQPGTVLVCPTTTPAWTPLFSQARALVTDIGGILAHGSIVAREYGIPAVMGTGIATQRIQNGQSVTVDGSAGTVTLGSASR